MRLVFALPVLTVVASPLGCTSLLGDFGGGSSTSEGADGGGIAPDANTGGDSMMPGGDGGIQGSPEGAATVPDGSQDAEASAPLQILSCTEWQNAQPTLVLQLAGDAGGGGGPINGFYLHHIAGMNAARLVVATSTPAAGATIFTIPESGSSTPSSFSVGVSPQAVQSTASGIAMLAQNYMNDTFNYYAIADTDPGTSSSSVSAPLASVGAAPGGTGNNVQTWFAPVSSTEFFTVASYPDPNGNYALASWLAPNQPQWIVAWRGTGQLAMNYPPVIDGANAYAFMGPPGTTGAPGALSQYTFATAGSTMLSSRSIVAAGENAATAAAAASNGTYSLAFVALSGAQQASMRIGNVAEAQINTFMIDDLPSLAFNVPSDGGLFDTTPFGGRGGIGARWLSNGDFGVIGTGGTGGGVAYTGLNFYVATSDGQWLIETAGTGKNVLAGHTVQQATFDLQQAVGALVLKFDIAWMEILSDGSYALYFNVLSCQL